MVKTLPGLTQEAANFSFPNKLSNCFLEHLSLASQPSKSCRSSSSLSLSIETVSLSESNHIPKKQHLLCWWARLLHCVSQASLGQDLPLAGCSSSQPAPRRQPPEVIQVIDCTDPFVLQNVPDEVGHPLTKQCGWFSPHRKGCVKILFVVPFIPQHVYVPRVYRDLSIGSF